MIEKGDEIQATDLADGLVGDAESAAWLAAHPETVAEVEIARRVRALLAELRAIEIQVPEDFAVRLMERVRGNEAMLNLLDLWLSAFGHALLELLDAFFDLLPQPGLAAV